jgi:hypothetical protein
LAVRVWTVGLGHAGPGVREQELAPAGSATSHRPIAMGVWVGVSLILLEAYCGLYIDSGLYVLILLRLSETRACCHVYKDLSASIDETSLRPWRRGKGKGVKKYTSWNVSFLSSQISKIIDFG